MAATRAGGRFVANSPQLLALIVRTIAFIFFAGSIWALLPLVARRQLGLGSAGYGLLLACVGVGALAAALLAPALKGRLSSRALYAASCLVVGGAAVSLAVSHSALVVAVTLALAGGAWIMGIGLLGAAYQGQLPVWVKARAVSYYLVAFQGANGIGALVVGGVAGATTTKTALLVVAASLGLVAVVTWRLSLPTAVLEDHQLTEPLPFPEIPGDVNDGPMSVTVDYPVAAGSAEAFIGRSKALRRMRRRTGAIHWHLHRDMDDPDRFTETFVVGSWEEHERQHARLEQLDEDVLDQIDALLKPGQRRVAHHALGVRAVDA